jgi:hypothetical protein
MFADRNSGKIGKQNWLEKHAIKSNLVIFRADNVYCHFKFKSKFELNESNSF